MLYRLKMMVESAGHKLKASYTLTEAADIIGISEATIRRMMEEGRIRGFRPRGHWRIDIWELERLITEEQM